MTPDDFNDYESGLDRDEAVVSGLDEEIELSDAVELSDVEAERDDTPFDESRRAYSGVVEGDDDVDISELESVGALLDDPDDADADLDPDDEDD